MTRLRPALVLLAVIVTSTLSLLLAKESLATRPLPPNEVRSKLTMPVATDGDPIDLSTGLFFAEHTDFFLPDVIPIMFTRTYRTADPSWSFASFPSAPVTYESDKTASPSSLDLFRSGSRYYIQNKFVEAIGFYQHAVDLEKQDPKLDTITWRVLVDNLGMAYGITGDLKRAKATFEYGLSRDPSYSMFHYNLACTYAEMGDLDSTMISLKNAYTYRANHNPGEGMPDPRTDPSFRRFMKNDKFLKFLDSLAATRA